MSLRKKTSGLSESVAAEPNKSAPNALIVGHFKARLIKAEEVREGLPMKALDDLAAVLGVDRSELADVVGISLRTLQRKTGDRLGPACSDRIARVRRILALAEDVLGEKAKAAKWLTSSSRVLRDVPFRMLDTDTGAQRVEQELRQIQYGIPA